VKTFSKITFLIILFWSSIVQVSSQSEQKPELLVQTGHTEEILSLRFTLNGSNLVSTGSRSVKIWDIKSGRELRSFSGHSLTQDPTSLGEFTGISPNGKVIAFKDRDGNVWLFDLVTGKQTPLLFKRPAIVTRNITFPEKTFSFSGRAVFTPDSRMVAGARGVYISLWDVATGIEVSTFQRNCKDFCSSVFGFSPDGKMLAAVATADSGLENAITVWDVNSRQELFTVDGLDDFIEGIGFSPDLKTIIGGTPNKIVKGWSVPSGRELFSLAFTNPVSFSRSGRTLLVVQGTDAKLLNATTGNVLAVLSRWEPSSRKGEELTNAVFSNDTLATVTRGYLSADIIKLWDASTGKYLRTLPAVNQNAIIFSPDGKLLASYRRSLGAWQSGTIKLWNVETGQEVQSLDGSASGTTALAFSSDSKSLASGGIAGDILFWDVASARSVGSLIKHSRAWFPSASPDNSVLVLRDTGLARSNQLRLVNIRSPQPVMILDDFKNEVEAIAFNANSSLVAIGSTTEVAPRLMSTIRLLDTFSGKELKTVKEHQGRISALEFSLDGRTLISKYYAYPERYWDLATGLEINPANDVPQQKPIPSFGGEIVLTYTISPETGMTARLGNTGLVTVSDLKTGKQITTIQGGSSIVRLAFTRDAKAVALIDRERTALWSIPAGDFLKSIKNTDEREIENLFPGSADYFRNLSQDPKWFFEMRADGRLSVFEAKNTNQLIANLFALDQDDWAVVTPDGRFDTTKLESPQGLHWLLPYAPLAPLSFEVFMRDYYEPKLLSRLVKCTEAGNCDREFKPVRDLSSLNHTQPNVKITRIAPADSTDFVSVTAEVESVTSEYQKDAKGRPLASGVYDLRLFRDGQLVGYSTTDERLQSTFRAYKNFDEELAVWREANSVELVKGKRSFTFKVQLPVNATSKDVEFSVYAFNEDRGKSETARATYSVPQNTNPKSKPRAFVISVGVNATENPSFNLRFAANDARRFHEILPRRLAETGAYSEVVSVALISDWEDRNGKRVVTQRDATKTNFKAVLDLLAGRTVSEDRKRMIPGSEALKQAKPDDLVLILFSSHGYADSNGVFYFIPYDIGPGTCKLFTDAVRQGSISSEELSLWVRDIDAGEMTLIVDACHSTAAIEAAGFKPGPMGSRGLGQLAYDKGMRILTATQADNVAIESTATPDGKTIQHGLLTYSLLEHGLSAGNADFKPADRKIFLSEWLEFGVTDVPRLFALLQTQSVVIPTEETSTNRLIAPRLTVQRELVEVAACGPAKQNLPARPQEQQPALFDFTRKKRDVLLIKE
jgi:WD40 repeat protein